MIPAYAKGRSSRFQVNPSKFKVYISETHAENTHKITSTFHLNLVIEGLTESSLLSKQKLQS